jgi:dephospho-CoA kinase
VSSPSQIKRGKVIGLLGGIASGKSVVTKLLAERGAKVLVADDIAHEVLQRNEVVKEIKRAFGEGVALESDPSKLDRKKIASMVFGRTAEHAHNRKVLESIVQTRVRTELEASIATWRRDVSEPTSRADSKEALLILDIPLLLERGWDKECDEILFVDTPLERRRQFARQRGWSEKDLEMREATQSSLEEKRKHATMIVRNDGSIEELQRELTKLTL